MLEASLLIILSLIALSFSADKLVTGASILARHFGVSPLLVGIIILGFGSSAPEMVVSVVSALDGHFDTAVGNVLGSNIINIALVLGVVAIISPVVVGNDIIRRELPTLIISLSVGFLVMYDGVVSYFDGIILLSCFALFIMNLIRIAINQSKSHRQNQNGNDVTTQSSVSSIEGQEEDATANDSKNSNLWAAFWVVVGLVGLPISANFLVENSVFIARHFGISDLVIGLTIIALGTSLPELSASLISSLKGEDDMSVGNIIGSNVFNLLAVLGLPAIIAPGPISEFVMKRDFWVMVAISLLLVLMLLHKTRRIGRIHGVLLITIFLSYTFYLLQNLG